MLHYPPQLKPLFQTLLKHNITPVIVGGFVRDSLLNIPSKDIDVELYAITSLSEIVPLLEPFGSLSSVGKSFEVYKLSLDTIEIDFSLPRKDSKVSVGHKGFVVEVDSSMSFTQASKRRDFTINAMGYNLQTQQLLDPYGGKEDLTNRVLRVVDEKTFQEDPLRVLRAVQFVARFELHTHPTTLQLLQKMVHNKLLFELPKERIYEEFKKLLIKGSKPSLGLLLLKKIGALNYFKPLRVLSQKEYFSVCDSLDTLQTLQTPNPKTHLFIAFALLCRFFNTQECKNFLTLLSDEKKLHQEVCRYLSVEFDLSHITPYALYKLAQHISIQDYLLFLQAQGVCTQTQRAKIKRWSLKLGIYTQAKKPLVSGKDLLQAGLKPSKEFSHILQKLYEKQIKGEFHTTQEGIDSLMLF